MNGPPWLTPPEPEKLVGIVQLETKEGTRLSKPRIVVFYPQYASPWQQKMCLEFEVQLKVSVPFMSGTKVYVRFYGADPGKVLHEWPCGVVYAAKDFTVTLTKG